MEASSDNEEVLRSRCCSSCGATFAIRRGDIAFYRKIDVPEPTCCFDCRELKRLLFHNERNLYRRSCDATGRSVITYFHPDTAVKVYDNPYWWSDSWSALDYGRDIDFSRPFFQQFGELLHAVPHANLFTSYADDENSEYTNYAGSNKNCYLIAHADSCRDCLYGYGVKLCESCVDVYNVVRCQFCYECVNCYGCYGLKYSQDSLNCSDSAFLRDCVGCRDCIACQNLRHKQYCFLNTQYTRTQFEQIRAQYLNGSHTALQHLAAKFEAQRAGLPHRGVHQLQCESCSGDQLTNCKNVQYSFEISDGEDLRYCTQLKVGAKDSMDVHQFGSGAELMYECSVCGNQTQRLRFCAGCYDASSDLTYCSGCSTSKDLFGCVNLRRAQYCILNKQYRRDEYLALTARLIEHMRRSGEWGEFFPPQLSLFAYNETRAQDFYPLTQAEAISRGFRWRDDLSGRAAEGQLSEFPDNVDQFSEAAAQRALRCAVSGKSYRITPLELKFYRNTRIPIPRLAPDERARARLKLVNPRRLWSRPCASCNVAFLSSYAPDRPELVYCEPCYETQALDKLSAGQQS